MKMTERTVHMNRKPSSSLACGSAVKKQVRSPKEISSGLKKKIRQHSRDNCEKDTRFHDPAFCQAVRQVLEYIAEEPSFENFRKYDGTIDWEAFAENINHPTRVALCHVLDGQGQEVTVEGTPVVVAKEIAACSESEAAEILAKETKVFVKWW
jgi:hypothetical protein